MVVDVTQKGVYSSYTHMKDGDELTMDYNIGIEEPPYYEVLCEQYDISEPWL